MLEVLQDTGYTQNNPMISKRLRFNPYPAIAMVADPAYAAKCSTSPGKPVRIISCAGSSDRNPNSATQHQVGKRSHVLSVPARICAGFPIGTVLASPVAVAIGARRARG